MRRYLLAGVFASLVFTLSPHTSRAFVDADNSGRKPTRGHAFVPGEVIIKGKPNFDVGSLNLNNFGVRNYRNLVRHRGPRTRNRGLERLYLLQVNDVGSAIKRLKQHPLIEYAEPNYIVHASQFPNDPDFTSLYGLHNTGQTGGTLDADIDAPEAWVTQTGDSSVVVAVIDTGVDYTHEDLAANMWANTGEKPNDGVDDDGNGFIDDYRGWDFVNNDNDPFDDHRHGTHCAGTIGAVGNNGKGVVGVSWSVKIMPLKFLNASGSGSTADAVSAINYATAMGAHIMSNSWGGGGFSQALEDAITAANNAGVLFVAAAGNSSSNNDVAPHYPSSYEVDNVVAVAATDHNDQKASFSSYGSVSVDLGAPGVSIFSTLPANSYGFLSGTSMATPHVSGAAALIMAQFPELTSNGIKSRLMGTVDPIASLDGITVTGGRLNTYNSLETDIDPPSPVTDLAAIDSTFNSVALTWTATGDDGTNETASSYDVRYSTSPINTAADWQAATKATGELKPQVSGSTESFSVTGLSYATTYYIGLEVFDNVGNPSGLSNIVSETTTTPTTVFADYMEGDLSGWTSEGLWHPETARSSSPETSWAYNTGSPDYSYDTGAANSGRLSSPVIDLSGYSSAALSFWHWHETEGGTTWDQRWVQIGVGGNFTNVTQLSGDPMGTWNEYTVDISSYAGKPNVQVGFFFNSIDSILNNFEGWYVDDLMVLGESTEPNNPPVANAGGPYSGTEDIAVVFDGSSSYDSDGDSLTYSWAFGDGTTGIGPTPSHVYTAGGSYPVTLVVNDGITNSSPDTTTVDITDINDPPVANAGPDQNGVTGVEMTFDGSGSSDEEGPIASYLWDFGDTTTGTGVNPSHTYTVAGSYTVTLTVNDGSVDSQPDTATVTITAPSTDNVNITKAEYNSMKSQLKVEAISSANGAAGLWVEGMQMIYNAKREKYSLVASYSPMPPTVTVTSDLGGTDTKTVAVKGTGKGKKK